MFLFEFLVNFIRQNENGVWLSYFPFITDWFLVFCVLFLLLLFVLYSYDILFLLKSVILFLFCHLVLLVSLFYFFDKGFFLHHRFEEFVILKDKMLFLNSLCINDQLLLLKILIVFISLFFFSVRFFYIKFYPSTKKEGLNYVLYNDVISLKNISIFYIFVLLFSIISILFLISSNNFLLAYLSLELFSLCSMILIGSSSKMFDIVNLLPLKSQVINNNLLWSLNYLLVSALGSSIFLLGVCYLYGHTGSINFCEIKLFFLNLSFNFLMSSFENISLFLALFLIFLGLLIKGGFAPFHFWIFELYKNLPYYLLTYFLLFSKIIIILFLFKISLFLNGCFFYVFFFFGILNILIGTFYLIKQQNIKLILIGSSINNSGYLLLSIAFSDFFSFYVFYIFLFVYLITNLGVLIVMSTQAVLFKRAKFIINLSSLSSLKFFTFFNKCALTFFVMSLMGLPFFLGFWSKSLLLMFYSEFDFFYLLLNKNVLNFFVCFFLVLNLISFLYYLNLISYLFFDQKNFSYGLNVMSKLYKSKFFLTIDFINFLLLNFLLFLNIFFIFCLLIL